MLEVGHSALSVSSVRHDAVRMVNGVSSRSVLPRSSRSEISSIACMKQLASFVHSWEVPTRLRSGPSL